MIHNPDAGLDIPCDFDAGDELDLKWRLARHEAAVDHALTKTALSQQSKDIYRAYVLEEEPLKADLAAYKAGEKTAQKVAAAHIAYAQKAEGEAAKYLLYQGAFKLYARCGEYDLAADAIQIMKRDIKDLPSAVIAEIVGDELRYISDAKAPRLVALLKEAKGKAKGEKDGDDAASTDVKWNYEVKNGAIVLRAPVVPKTAKGALAIPEFIDGKPVRGIGADGFLECGITTLTIPTSVMEIGTSPTADCSELMRISVDAGNANYCSKNGQLCTKDGMNLIAGINGKVTIPAGVKNIGRGAFCGYGKLTSVVIPEGVTNIGFCAFVELV